MTKRQTQLFALMLLVGAPLIVSLMGGYLLPSLHEIAPAPQQPAAPAYMQPAPDPAAGLPPGQPAPPPSPAQQTGPQAGGNYTPVAILDPNGVAVSGSDPTPLAPVGSDGSASGSGSASGQSGGQPATLTADQQHAMNDVH